jgi:hypothetical protein
MASANFLSLTDKLARAGVNYGSDTFKIMLLSAVPSESNLDTWDFRNDVSTEIAAGGGYTAGGIAVTAAVGAVDTTNNRVPVTFTVGSPAIAAFTGSFVAAIIYKVVGTAATDPVLHMVDFGGTITGTAGPLEITLSTPFYINR